jgi:glucoamylase
MAAMAGRCGLITEQIWDSPAIPERSLLPGQASGAATPLVWAHAEFIKLVASLAMRRSFDRPEATWQRYLGRRPDPKHAIWTPRFEIAEIRSGQALCLCLPAAARVHYGFDGWQGITDIDTSDSGLTQHVVALPTGTLARGSRIDFTLFWLDSATWDGHDHRIDVR